VYIKNQEAKKNKKGNFVLRKGKRKFLRSEICDFFFEEKEKKLKEVAKIWQKKLCDVT
jgi:hypothetical protein